MSLALQTGKALVQFSPGLQLETAFVLDDRRRIVSTREPAPDHGPMFYLIRGSGCRAWAAHADLSEQLLAELDRLVREEPPASDYRRAPLHTRRYESLVGGRVFWGPVFAFPETLPVSADVVAVDDCYLLKDHFPGWTPQQLAGHSPVLAVVIDGRAVSIGYCARRSSVAAEAGVDTAKRWRGLGYGPCVTAAWAHAVRASGRFPIYSTSWDNQASLAIARKLHLVMCASDWSLSH